MGTSAMNFVRGLDEVKLGRIKSAGWKASDQMTSGKCGRLLVSEDSRRLPIALWMEMKNF